MSRSAGKWMLLATLTAVMPVTLVCEVPELDYLLDRYEFEVYYDYDQQYDDHHGCWFDCDDDWSFDFDWWW
jgi:hypothetical protein